VCESQKIEGIGDRLSALRGKIRPPEWDHPSLLGMQRQAVFAEPRRQDVELRGHTRRHGRGDSLLAWVDG
jgi:hypothetical protein